MQQTFTVTIKHEDAFEALRLLSHAVAPLNPVRVEHAENPVELHTNWAGATQHVDRWDEARQCWRHFRIRWNGSRYVDECEVDEIGIQLEETRTA